MLMLSLNREESTLVVPMARLMTRGFVSEAILMAACGVYPVTMPQIQSP